MSGYVTACDIGEEDRGRDEHIRREERERCAKIAEQADRDPYAPYIYQGVEIASAIRKG